MKLQHCVTSLVKTKMNFIITFCVVSLIPVIICQNPETITLKVDEYYTLVSDKFPNPYPKGSKSWLINSGEGFGVEVIIKSLDLNTENGDYVLFQPGGKGIIQEKATIFTWKLRRERKYRLQHLDDLYISFYANTDIHDHKGFEMSLKAIGEVPVTTETPTTEDPSLIMRPLTTSIIYLRGMNVTEFFNGNYNETFKEELAKMAEAYCEKKNITIETNITISRNINFHIITYCPLDWYDSLNCIKIRYSIPVNNKNLTSGYELSTTSLDDMWYNNRKDFNWTDLDPLTIAFAPNSHGEMMGWVWVSVGVLIIFLIFLYLFQRYNCFDDVISSLLIQEDVERRKSDASLFPTPHQDLPPLFISGPFPPEENTWPITSPPEYSEKPLEGEINHAFEKENILFDDEIVMVLEDSADQKSQLTRRSVESMGGDESNL